MFLFAILLVYISEGRPYHHKGRQLLRCDLPVHCHGPAHQQCADLQTRIMQFVVCVLGNPTTISSKVNA